LNKHNDQLLKYVNEGGHLVVQHNLPGEWDENHIAPYPLKLGTPSIDWRVTDQDSDVKILNPIHLCFIIRIKSMNKIGKIGYKKEDCTFLWNGMTAMKHLSVWRIQIKKNPLPEGF